MRRVAWVLLLLLAFTVPWEFSLNLGPPLGNAARIAGLLLLLAAVPAILQAGSMRRPGTLQWLVLALYVWFCCSYFWTIDQAATLERIRGYFQEMMIVWLVWEFAESPRDLRALLRAFVAGAWVLALLTLADFRSPAALAAGQIRFAAYGQDPNDVARSLVLVFPIAALLANGEAEAWLGSRWPERVLALGYFPLGVFALLLTASRGGFLAGTVALAGCGVLLARGHRKTVLGGFFASPALAAALWFLIPREIFDRLATIPEQIANGGLNQRLNIWSAGWQSFARAPWAGTGAGTFVTAAGLAPADTAHNTALSIAVSGGLLALSLALAIGACVLRLALCTRGVLRRALATALLVWAITSLVGTVEESRATWLLFALVAVAGRMAEEEPAALRACFPDAGAHRCLEAAAPLAEPGSAA